MESLLLIMGFILALLFFTNIRPASEVLCRILCGFAVLIGLNTASAAFTSVTVGVNILTALIVGIFGAPGAALLFAASLL